MIIVTGGAGFIGSALVWHLNQQGVTDILVVDELGTEDKWLNLSKRKFQNIMHIDDFLPWLPTAQNIRGIVHMGACSTTTETDADYLIRNNVHYSMSLFKYCADHQIPYIYASSAATYGEGEHGYDDASSATPKLKPINKYGFSKHVFDRWVLDQTNCPSVWAGLKFFNVYGPQEYHKGSQASVAYHAFPQVQGKGSLKLFKSYREGIAHGDQMRDFVYVKDVVKVIDHCFNKMKPEASGLYNVGTGKARSFADLGRAVFASLDREPKFDWIDMPENLQQQYQYFTEADLTRLVNVCGYKDEFTSVEDGVRDYIVQYLNKDDAYL